MSGTGTRRGIRHATTWGAWKQRLLSALSGTLLGIIIPTLALGQATLLPDAKQQYLTDSGTPVAGGQVFYYVPSTTNKKTVWLDAGQTTPSTNPVILDAAGRPQPTGQTFGNGLYRQKVVDANGLTIWDAVTTSTGGGSGPSPPNPATGDGNQVGTILLWSGWTLPNQYMYTDGHVVSRTTYPELLTATTHTVNVICTAGLPTLTGIPFGSTFNVPIGAAVEASCVAPGSVVVSKATNSLTVSNNASVSTAVSARIFFFGNGNGSTTFNLPDTRSSVPAGMDAMDPVVGARGVLIPPYFPPNGLGAATASPSTTLLLANLPPITPAGTITNGAITNTVTGGVNGGISTSTAVAAAGVQVLSGSTPIAVGSAQATSTFTGAVGGGTSVPVSVVQPTIMFNYIIKVTPDANSATATGVLSLGGMTGAIACGTDLLCTGNTISLNGLPVFSPGSATIGNVAFWMDTAATTLGSTPAHISTNPGNSALFSSIANSSLTSTTVNNLAQFSLGAPVPTSEQFKPGTTGGISQALVGTVDLPAGDTTFGGIGVAGYARNHTNSTAVAGGAVGLYGQSTCEIVGSNCSALNTVTQNSASSVFGPGFSANSLIGVEFNTNVWKLPGGADPVFPFFYGALIQGSGDNTGDMGTGLYIGPQNVSTHAKWINGVQFGPGAAEAAINIGPAAASGSSLNSQTVTMSGVNGASATKTGTYYVDSNGAFLFIPASGGSWNAQDGAGAIALSVGGYGGSNVTLPKLTTAGVIINSASGVLDTLAGTTTTVLHGSAGGLPTYGKVANADMTNTATTVNGQTCTLGSTCTVTASATGITVGSTTIASGTSHGVLTNNAGNLGNTAAGTNGQLLLGVTGAEPAFASMSGDATISSAGVVTLGSTITAGGPTGSATVAPIITYDAKGRLTTVSSATITPAVGSITGLGTGVGTALAINVGTAGSPVVQNGALGTPSSGTVTNLTGTASININGTVGATTPTTIAATTATASTSLTSPLHIGGSGTTGTQLTLQTTTGNGTTDAFAFKGGNNGATTFATLQTGSFNIQSGSSYNINGTSVLNSTTLGSGVTGSSLTSLGTIGSLTATTASITNALTFGIGGTGATAVGMNMNGGSANNGGPYVLFQRNSVSKWQFGTQSVVLGGASDDLILYNISAGATSMNMSNTSGGVCFGCTTDPGAGSIQVNGQIFVPNAASDTATLDSTACIASSGGKLLKGTGTLGICLGTSSREFKQDIVSMGAGLAEIVQLEPKNFFYKKGFGDDNKRLQYGLIAEEVAQILPGVTTADSTGKPQAVDLLALVPVLINAVKQLKADNDNLRKDFLASQTKAAIK